jgi:hypothetical protein
MLVAAHGIYDGVDVARFRVGEIYDVPASVASVLMVEQWADLAPERAGTDATSTAPGQARAAPRDHSWTQDVHWITGGGVWILR